MTNPVAPVPAHGAPERTGRERRLHMSHTVGVTQGDETRGIVTFLLIASFGRGD